MEMPTVTSAYTRPPPPSPGQFLTAKENRNAVLLLFVLSPPKSMGSVNVEGITDTGQQMHASSFKQRVLFSVFYHVLTSWGTATAPTPPPKGS